MAVLWGALSLFTCLGKFYFDKEFFMNNDLQTTLDTADMLGRQGYSCSEAVFLALSSEQDFPPELGLKLACGLAGGLGLSGETCGVVTAAALALGLRFGPAGIDERFQRQHTLLLVGEFVDRFQKQHGTSRCCELCLQGVPPTPERGKAIRESGLPLELIRSGVRIASEVMLEAVDHEGKE